MDINDVTRDLEQFLDGLIEGHHRAIDCGDYRVVTSAFTGKFSAFVSIIQGVTDPKLSKDVVSRAVYSEPIQQKVHTCVDQYVEAFKCKHPDLQERAAELHPQKVADINSALCGFD